MMRGFVESLAVIKDTVALSGFSGVLYAHLLENLKISPMVGCYIAKNYLVPDDFTFYSQTSHRNIDIAEINILPDDILCFAPELLILNAFGLPNDENPAYDKANAIKLVECIASSGVYGCTVPELSQQVDLKNIHSLVDRIINTGAIVKQIITPLSGDRKARATSTSVLLHLKRYAYRFRPEEHGVFIQPSEEVKDIFYSRILEILDENKLEYITAFDLGNFLGMNKKESQYLRQQIVSQRQQGQPTIVDYQYILAASESKSSIGFGKFATRNCLVRGTKVAKGIEVVASCDHDFDKSVGTEFDRIRNLPFYELLNYNINHLPNGITSNDMRRMSGISHKKATRLLDEFIKVLKYPNVKTQEGKCVMTRILPKAPEGESLHPVKSSSYSQQPAAVLDKVGLEGTYQNKRISEERKQKEEMIMNYLYSQPAGVGSVKEVSWMIKDHSRKMGKSYKVDKKTIMRALEEMAGQGMLHLFSIEWSELSKEEVKEFYEPGSAAAPHVQLICINPNDALDERVRNYLSSYRKPSKKMITGDLPDLNVKDPVELKETEPVEVAAKELPKTAGKPSRKRKLLKVENTSSGEPLKKARVKPSVKKLSSDSFHEETSTLHEMLSVESVEPITADSDVISKKKVAFEPRATVEEEWTPTPDYNLLLNFFDTFLVRRIRWGLPQILKPSDRLKSFKIFPWNSVFDISFGSIEISWLRNAYVYSTSVTDGSHTMGSCRARLPTILKNVHRDIKEVAVHLCSKSRQPFNKSQKSLLDYIIAGTRNKPEQERVVLLNKILQARFFPLLLPPLKCLQSALIFSTMCVYTIETRRDVLSRV